MGNIGRRRFLGAGIATATAALVVPKTTAVAQPTQAPEAGPTAAPPVPPDAQSLVPIPPGRVDAAVRDLDGLIEHALSRTGVPGLAAAVVHRGRLRYAKGFGVRNVDTGVPVDKRTVFRLASVSKSLSATVVSGIVGGKHAGWSDPVVRYLPSFALSDRYVTRHVSIGDLFSHRSGLPEYAGDLLEDLGYEQDYILHALRLEPLDPFRDVYAYTNFGLTAAAVAAAAAAGSDWATIAERILFRPLDMNATSFRYADFLRRSDRAEMHVRENGKWYQRYARDADAEAPAGGASSNVLDLARWMSLRLANGAWNGKPLIDADALAEADLPRSVASPPSTPSSRSGFYGYGVDVGYDYSGRLRLSHSGAFAQGAATNYVLLPAEQLGIVVLTNGMPIGVPEAITAYFLDLVIGGAIENDWIDLYGQAFAALYINHSELAGKKPPAHPRPARPASFYVGRYANEYYGQIRIVAEGSTLHLLIGPKPLDYPLQHWDGNLLSFYPTGENALGITAATFTPDRSGRHARSVTLEYYDRSGWGTFTRR